MLDLFLLYSVPFRCRTDLDKSEKAIIISKVFYDTIIWLTATQVFQKASYKIIALSNIEGRVFVSIQVEESI